MSFAYGFGLPHWQPLSGAFSPLSLFSGGVQGAFYDPSDPTVLFSDRAGTTPCGTPGGGSVVPVGLMLDKSQGLVLGPEICPNGTFDNATGWTLTAGASISGGKLNFSAAAAQNPNAFIALTGAANGDVYSITFTVSDYVSGQVNIRLYSSGSSSVPVSANGTYTVLLAVPVSNANLGIATIGASTTLSIDNLSVKKYLGNHAIAANDTTARPELRARVNLITYSEEFDNGAWTKNRITLTTNSTLAPNNTLTADTATVSTTGNYDTVRRPSAGLIANTRYSFSVFAKAGATNWLNLRFWDAGVNGINAWFNLATGTTGTVEAGCTASISDQGNGWYRCSITRTVGSSIAFNELDIGVTDGDNTLTGTVGASIIIWGAQLTATNEFPANTYQRISDANTYDAVGFPRYLAFNGTSSAMSTPGNVNLSGTDKVTVFAGVRKLSTGVGGIVELSATSANPGTFNLYANGAGANDYFFGINGTSLLYGYNVGFAPPVSNVLTEQLNQAGATDAQRVSARSNGTSLALTYSGNIGTPGNFGTYPLFIGARNTSSLFLNGNLYSLIVVGSAVSAGNISSTEQWVAQRTGVTI